MKKIEIIRKINSFPRWHYQFDLNGNLTPIAKQGHVNRHLQRKRYFFEPLVELLDGSLRGKRVLDLGCNAGFWSLCAIEKECDFVLGIDGRQMHIDQANFVFEVNQIEKSRYNFVVGNIFNIDFRKFGNFDIVLCLGLIYHVNKPFLLIEKITQVNSDILLIDTELSRVPGSYLEFGHYNFNHPKRSVEYSLVTYPTKQSIIDMAQQFSYSVVMLKPQFQDYSGARDYRLGMRRAFLCAKKSKLSNLSVKIESINLRTQILDTIYWVAQITHRRRMNFIRMDSI